MIENVAKKIKSSYFFKTWGSFRQEFRTVRTEEPNFQEPEPNSSLYVKPIRTGTESFLKFITETEEFWNRPSTIEYW